MITFSRVTQTHDPTTDLVTPTVTTITGDAFQRTTGDPETYRNLGLIQSQAPTLLFVPTTYGQVPQPGDTAPWPAGGDTFTVRDVRVIAPDGVVIAAYVVIAQ